MVRERPGRGLPPAPRPAPLRRASVTPRKRYAPRPTAHPLPPAPRFTVAVAGAEARLGKKVESSQNDLTIADELGTRQRHEASAEVTAYALDTCLGYPLPIRVRNPGRVACHQREPAKGVDGASIGHSNCDQSESLGMGQGVIGRRSVQPLLDVHQHRRTACPQRASRHVETLWSRQLLIGTARQLS